MATTKPSSSVFRMLKHVDTLSPVPRAIALRVIGWLSTDLRNSRIASAPCTAGTLLGAALVTLRTFSRAARLQRPTLGKVGAPARDGIPQAQRLESRPEPAAVAEHGRPRSAAGRPEGRRAADTHRRRSGAGFLHDGRGRLEHLGVFLGAPGAGLLADHVLDVLGAHRLLPEEGTRLGEDRQVVDGDHCHVPITGVDEGVVVPRGAGEEVTGLERDLLAVHVGRALALDPVVDRDGVVPVTRQ